MTLYRSAFETSNSRNCIGTDPSTESLPRNFFPKDVGVHCLKLPMMQSSSDNDRHSGVAKGKTCSKIHFGTEEKRQKEKKKEEIMGACRAFQEAV